MYMVNGKMISCLDCDDLHREHITTCLLTLIKYIYITIVWVSSTIDFLLMSICLYSLIILLLIRIKQIQLISQIFPSDFLIFYLFVLVSCHVVTVIPAAFNKECLGKTDFIVLFFLLTHHFCTCSDYKCLAWWLLELLLYTNNSLTH